MWTQNWQSIIRYITIPSFFLLSCYWLVPESTRWLLNKGRNREVADILLKSAKCNKTKLSDEVLELLVNHPENMTTDSHKGKQKLTENVGKYELKDIFQYPKFCLRIIAVAYCWLTNIFISYGLTFTSVAIGGNKYIDYIWVALIEIPGQFFVIYSTQRFGRKKILIGGYLTCGAAILATAFVKDVYSANLTLFLIGKLAITITLSTIYIFTTEIFPTNMRQTLFSICSAVGRIGSMIATQASVLQTVFDTLPNILFGSLALIATFVCFTFPETLNSSLPDTIEDSLDIGKKKKAQDINLMVRGEYTMCNDDVST